MRLLNKGILEGFRSRYPDARAQVNALIAEVATAEWRTPHDLKARYPKASIVGAQNAIFDIKGGKYRIWVKVDYINKLVFLKRIGKHEDYERWDIR